MEKERLRSKKMTILLSVNAAAVLIAGVLISSSIWLNGGLKFRAVDERSDIVDDDVKELELLESVSDSNATVKDVQTMMITFQLQATSSIILPSLQVNYGTKKRLQFMQRQILISV